MKTQHINNHTQQGRCRLCYSGWFIRAHARTQIHSYILAYTYEQPSNDSDHNFGIGVLWTIKNHKLLVDGFEEGCLAEERGVRQVLINQILIFSRNFIYCSTHTNIHHRCVRDISVCSSVCSFVGWKLTGDYFVICRVIFCKRWTVSTSWPWNKYYVCVCVACRHRPRHSQNSTHRCWKKLRSLIQT